MRKIAPLALASILSVSLLPVALAQTSVSASASASTATPSPHARGTTKHVFVAPRKPGQAQKTITPHESRRTVSKRAYEANQQHYAGRVQDAASASASASSSK